MGILFKAFFESLAWAFYCKSTNNRINHLQERALRLVYGDYELKTFEEILEKGGSFTIHHYYIQT